MPDWANLPRQELKAYVKAMERDNRALPTIMAKFDPPESAVKTRYAIIRDSKPLVEIWRSRFFLCQIFDHGEVERLSVNRAEVDFARRRWRDGITWDELQEIKFQVGRGDRWATEIFPPDASVVDIANIRHLWVWKQGCPLDFVWKKRQQDR